jgi:hypothetical protein
MPFQMERHESVPNGIGEEGKNEKHESVPNGIGEEGKNEKRIV